jgi:hypothetical protein
LVLNIAKTKLSMSPLPMVLNPTLNPKLKSV